MIKNKLKTLILIMVLGIATTSFKVFATTGALSESQTPPPDSSNQTPQPAPGAGNTILDGKIGEWDDESIKEFQGIDGEDLEGKKPEAGEYFTISVTVPINMEFWVLPNSTQAFGSFYSPKYTVKNNGSKNVVARINDFTRVDEVETETTTPLYVEDVAYGDTRTQIELKMCAVDKADSFKLSKEVDLKKIGTLEAQEKVLFELSANEIRKVRFDATRWELPKYESGKDSATSKFVANFEFSIKSEK